jgi:hypothetical protein
MPLPDLCKHIEHVIDTVGADVGYQGQRAVK